MSPLSDAQVVALRPDRHVVSAWQPYAFTVEEECSPAGRVELVATVFLTNRECPLRCVMCDLWKNTLTERVPRGAIPAQLEYALQRLPPAPHVKLYNSGNFFDAQAIPPADHAAIAQQVADFETVIVENHPRFCGPRCREFAQRVSGQLEVAIGLETVHPDVLPRLNKRMTVADYDRAVSGLQKVDVAVRTFVLLAPPFLEIEAAEEWCLRSVEHAFAQGARVCSIIPTRGGNGAMEWLSTHEQYRRPTLRHMERVQQAAVGGQPGRVFVDLWDAASFADCPHCATRRIDRMNRINLTQEVEPPIECPACAVSV